MRRWDDIEPVPEMSGITGGIVDDLRTVGLSVVAVVLVLAMSAVLVLTTLSEQRIPRCAEDEVITGIGDYRADGLWDGYECTHIEEVGEVR